VERLVQRPKVAQPVDFTPRQESAWATFGR
jgi:hypothetical protein